MELILISGLSGSGKSVALNLLEDSGYYCVDTLPPDWRARVRVGSDRRHSATAREHLSSGQTIPETLPDTQRKLVDHMAPGLRELLGYA